MGSTCTFRYVRLPLWRKVDSWTALTDGSCTWVTGLNGIQERLNSECFDLTSGIKDVTQRREFDDGWYCDYRHQLVRRMARSNAANFFRVS